MSLPPRQLVRVSSPETCPALAAGGSRCAGHRRGDRQRDGRPKDIVGIVTPLGFDQPLRIATVASRDAVQVFVAGEKIWIAAGERDGVKGVACRAHPKPMPLLLDLVRRIDEPRDNLDQHMVPTQAEGGRLLGRASAVKR